MGNKSHPITISNADYIRNDGVGVQHAGLRKALSRLARPDNRVFPLDSFASFGKEPLGKLPSDEDEAITIEPIRPLSAGLFTLCG